MTDFKIGDRVEIGGKDGTIVDCRIWPWGVRFDDGQYCVFAADDMELIEPAKPSAEPRS